MDDGCKVLGNMYRSALMRFTSNLINSEISDTVVVGYDNKYMGLFTNYVLVIVVCECPHNATDNIDYHFKSS